MLQRLDNEHLNRLAVAEALSKLNPTEFDMRDGGRCICAHTLRLLAPRRSTRTTRAASRYLAATDTVDWSVAGQL